MARPRRVEQLIEPNVPICADNVIHLAAVKEAHVALPPRDDLDRLSALFATLGDPTRLRIVAALATHELCVCDIAAVVGLTESAVSHHLRLLRATGVVRHRRDGRLALYALDDEHIAILFRQAADHISHHDLAPAT